MNIPENLQMVDDSIGPNIWDYFQKESPMSGEEIADELGQTRQNVSRILKKIFGQTYYMVKNDEPEKSPFEIAIQMSRIFGLDYSMETEVKKFFRLFPPEIKRQIKKDGKYRMESGKRRILSTMF